MLLRRCVRHCGPLGKPASLRVNRNAVHGRDGTLILGIHSQSPFAGITGDRVRVYTLQTKKSVMSITPSPLT
jgi:hypothetical protein